MSSAGEGSSSSSTPSNPDLIGEIKILTTAGDVYQCNEDNTDYTRTAYTISNLQNPMELSGQQVFVDLYPNSADDLHSIQIMHTIRHDNILRCYTYNMYEMKYYEVCLEKFIGPLSHILENRRTTFVYKNYIPSITLTKLMRSIVDVLIFLHEKKMYHGALSWKTLLYIYKDGDIVVKLAYFCKRNDLSLSEAQGEDWVAVASMLREINDRIDLDKRIIGVYDGHITRAINFCENVNNLTEDDRRNIPTLIHDLDFFLRPQDRMKYAARLFHWCENESYRSILENSNIVGRPWNVFGDSKIGRELLKTMNNFKDKDGKSKTDNDYNVHSIVDFLKFISGMYAHCDTIQSEVCGLNYIDKFVCTEFPELFYDLRMMQREKGLIP